MQANTIADRMQANTTADRMQANTTAAESALDHSPSSGPTGRAPVPDHLPSSSSSSSEVVADDSRGHHHHPHSISSGGRETEHADSSKHSNLPPPRLIPPPSGDVDAANRLPVPRHHHDDANEVSFSSQLTLPSSLGGNPLPNSVNNNNNQGSNRRPALRPPTPSVRKKVIESGDSLRLFNSSTDRFEACVVSAVYDDGTFDAFNDDGDVHERIDEQYIDPEQLKTMRTKKRQPYSMSDPAQLHHRHLHQHQLQQYDHPPAHHQLQQYDYPPAHHQLQQYDYPPAHHQHQHQQYDHPPATPAATSPTSRDKIDRSTPTHSDDVDDTLHNYPIDHSSMSISGYDTFMAMRGSTSNDHSSHFQHSVAPFIPSHSFYRPGMMVEVFISGLFVVDEQSIGLWFSGMVLSQLGEEHYLVRVDTDSTDGAMIERPFHVTHIRPRESLSTTAGSPSFDYHDNLLSLHHVNDDDEEGEGEGEGDPQHLAAAASQDTLTASAVTPPPKMMMTTTMHLPLPQRPKTAPDMRRLNPRMIGSKTMGK